MDRSKPSQMWKCVESQTTTIEYLNVLCRMDTLHTSLVDVYSRLLQDATGTTRPLLTESEWTLIECKEEILNEAKHVFPSESSWLLDIQYLCVAIYAKTCQWPACEEEKKPWFDSSTSSKGIGAVQYPEEWNLLWAACLESIHGYVQHKPLTCVVDEMKPFPDASRYLKQTLSASSPTHSPKDEDEEDTTILYLRVIKKWYYSLYAGGSFAFYQNHARMNLRDASDRWNTLRMTSLALNPLIAASPHWWSNVSILEMILPCYGTQVQFLTDPFMYAMQYGCSQTNTNRPSMVHLLNVYVGIALQWFTCFQSSRTLLVSHGHLDMLPVAQHVMHSIQSWWFVFSSDVQTHLQTHIRVPLQTWLSRHVSSSSSSSIDSKESAPLVANNNKWLTSVPYNASWYEFVAPLTAASGKFVEGYGIPVPLDAMCGNTPQLDTGWMDRCLLPRHGHKDAVSSSCDDCMTTTTFTPALVEAMLAEPLVSDSKLSHALGHVMERTIQPGDGEDEKKTMTLLQTRLFTKMYGESRDADLLFQYCRALYKWVSFVPLLKQSSLSVSSTVKTTAPTIALAGAAVSYKPLPVALIRFQLPSTVSHEQRIAWQTFAASPVHFSVALLKLLPAELVDELRLAFSSHTHTRSQQQHQSSLRPAEMMHRIITSDWARTTQCTIVQLPSPQTDEKALDYMSASTELHKGVRPSRALLFRFAPLEGGWQMAYLSKYTSGEIVSTLLIPDAYIQRIHARVH